MLVCPVAALPLTYSTHSPTNYPYIKLLCISDTVLVQEVVWHLHRTEMSRDWDVGWAYMAPIITQYFHKASFVVVHQGVCHTCDSYMHRLRTNATGFARTVTGQHGLLVFSPTNV